MISLIFARLLIVVLLALSFGIQGQVKDRLLITISKQEVTTEETFQMVVSASRVGEQEDLDVSALSQNFEIIDINFDKYSYLMNRQLSNSSTWIITLRPTKTGELTIPSVRLGQTLSPEEYIEVVDVDEELAKKGPPLSIETRLSHNNAIVGQDVLYTILVFQEPDVVRRRIYQNFPNDIEAIQLGQDEYIVEYEVGKPVKFSRRYYLLNALDEGSYDIPAPTFTGVARTRNRGNFGRVFSTEEDVSIVGNSTSIRIEPLPKQTNEKTVLASNIEMTASWQSPSFKVGEPNVLTVNLQAVGINSDRLPNVLINLPESLRGYPENTSRVMSVKADNLLANLTSTIAIIPTLEGDISIPNISIDWYNVDSKMLDRTELTFDTLSIQKNINSQITNRVVYSWYTDFRLYLLLCFLLLIAYVIHVRKLKAQLNLRVYEEPQIETPKKLSLNNVINAKNDKELPIALKAYLDNKLPKQPSLTHHQNSDALKQASPELCRLIELYFEHYYGRGEQGSEVNKGVPICDNFYQSLQTSLTKLDASISKNKLAGARNFKDYIY